MKIVTVIGARPQFIKAGVVSNAFSAIDGLNEFLVHTGQHFDDNMSRVFFEQLGIPKPDEYLDIHGGMHGQMTGRMLAAIESTLIERKPDLVMVYGDTNSTLAGSLAASKLNIPVAHVEAGLRSYNMRMPEEVNRILTDQISDYLFCPTETAINNLCNEGFKSKSCLLKNVGDVMQDSAVQFADKAVRPAAIKTNSDFILATIHRAENTDNLDNLKSIVEALNYIHANIAPVVIPLHPRTLKCIAESGLSLNVDVLEPVGYLEMLWLLNNCQLVLTDSGGLQKEAFFFGKYCVTLREETEWVELVDEGANVLVGSNTDLILRNSKQMLGKTVDDEKQLYGGGKASQRIAQVLSSL
ncbi:non-hydrolyzing UDP-N-acetylglucosamine 2-epimerase [Neptuniibacter sp. QD34_54]|uniref:non-hydrolyzing UDP-N-acetylglucosamine 2-epimerase n=1 Tax=Neptuniibacter sp. QD34_54 TaxID=3398208 RepID=UPI0039F60F6B